MDKNFIKCPMVWEFSSLTPKSFTDSSIEACSLGREWWHLIMAVTTLDNSRMVSLEVLDWFRSMDRKLIGTTISVLRNSNSNAILELASTHNWRNSRSSPQSSAFITNWSQCIKKKHRNQLKMIKKRRFLWLILTLQTISQPSRKKRLIEWPTKIHLAPLLLTSSKTFMEMPKFTMIF